MKHLVVTTIPLAFYTAAYAGTLYWFATFLVGEVAGGAAERAWSEATLSVGRVGLWWAIGVFLPVWVIFSWYGWWLRVNGYDGALPRVFYALLSFTITALPWFWPVLAVRHPRLVLRNYARRFRGETLAFMDEQGGGVLSPPKPPPPSAR
jgi:hypothetical protein